MTNVVNVFVSASIWTCIGCFCRLSTVDVQDYDTVKETLQMRYNLTEYGYREKFRQCAPEDGENAAMYVTRLKTYLERWIDLAKIEKEYSELRDLFVKEQFMDACPKDLAAHRREKRSKTLDNVYEEAESFLVARRSQLSTNKQFQRQKSIKWRSQKYTRQHWKRTKTFG